MAGEVKKNRRLKWRSRPVKQRKWGDQVVRLGMSHSAWGDVYHSLLTVGWLGFLGMVLLAYAIANTVFALLYLVGGDGISNATPGSFFDAFFFSVQTMSTIGYGSMSPQTTYTDAIVTIESLFGLLSVAMATGLMFARFARPTAKVMFSRVAAIAPHNGVPTLMFRAANQRQNQILEAKLWVVLVRNEVTREGESIRRFYDLPLLRRETPLFALTWTAMHPVNETSPFHGVTKATLQEWEAEILVTLTGLDETFGQPIHARHSYKPQEILWNVRFADILSKMPDGRRRVDYRHFHDVIPLE